MKAAPKLISKTRMMKGFRCTKAIYLNVFSPELEAPITPEQQALFDQGNAVGEEARKQFPGGVLVDNKPWDFIGSLKKTRSYIEDGSQIIFEAAFEHNGCYARADVIKFSSETKRWTIYEVKSSTKVKPEHIDDVGLQTWIIANAKLPIEQIYLLHLDPDCHYPDLSNLFRKVDVTEKLREKYPSVLPRVTEIVSTLQSASAPAIDIGQHCLEPNECGFQAACWKEKNIPEVSVFDLPQIRDKKWDFYKRGLIDLDAAPIEELSEIQRRALKAHTTGKRFVDADGIKKALSAWKFPLVFLDFETINPALPRYRGCGPYEHVPFQFSAHIWPETGAAIEHREYLHCEPTDPRADLISPLLQSCVGTGSVVTYYARFEIDRIKELIAFAPEHGESFGGIISRMVDPLPVIRDFIYDPGFKGSFSLKAVAPALLGNNFSYDGMLVSDGRTAQRGFEELIVCSDPKRKEELRQGMLEYCRKDTLVMVELVKWLFEASKEHDGSL